MSNDLLVLNGIDGASGEYLLPPMSLQDLSRIARGKKLDDENLRELKWLNQLVDAGRLADRGPRAPGAAIHLALCLGGERDVRTAPGPHGRELDGRHGHGMARGRPSRPGGAASTRGGPRAGIS
jgi:hypothetical protein